MTITITEPVTTVRFVAYGTPAPQGSKAKWGAEDNPRTRPWRHAVATAAAEALPEGFELTHGPVEVIVTFFFKRPQSHYRTGRHAGELKPGAPNVCTSGYDLDKLQRAIGDALQGVVLRDDKQIVHWAPWKLYGTPERAEILVRPVDPAGPSRYA